MPEVERSSCIDFRHARYATFEGRANPASREWPVDIVSKASSAARIADSRAWQTGCADVGRKREGVCSRGLGVHVADNSAGSSVPTARPAKQEHVPDEQPLSNIREQVTKRSREEIDRYLEHGPFSTT